MLRRYNGVFYKSLENLEKKVWINPDVFEVSFIT